MKRLETLRDGWGPVCRTAAAVVLMLACLALATPAQAGAWPRGKGNVFLTFSHHATAGRLSGPVYNYTAFYMEYGLNETLTLGLDLGHGVSGEDKAIVFLRGPLWEPGRFGRLGWEMGLGRIAGANALRPGLSYGMDLPGGAGWLALDILIEIPLDAPRLDRKADLTLGLNHSDRLRSIWQLQTGKSQGDPGFARIAPSLVWKLRDNTHVELGASAEMRSARAFGLKLGIWQEF